MIYYNIIQKQIQTTNEENIQILKIIKINSNIKKNYLSIWAIELANPLPDPPGMIPIGNDKAVLLSLLWNKPLYT